MHNYPAIVQAIFTDYALPVLGDHGVIHWARVQENGLKIAELNGADTEVVKLFALFHDSRRVNEYYDQDHGLRGGDFVRSLRGSLVHLNDQQFELLYEACRLHTDGHTDGEVTLQACWDADRLDLGRVGITPVPERLCTDAGRKLLRWANQRAIRNYQPMEVMAVWGLKDVE